MKWTIHELMKLENVDNTFEETLDFTDYLENTDIIGISPVKVRGDFEIYDQNEFVFYMDIDCTLILACAITLDDVEYPIHLTVEETFSITPNKDFHSIEGITIDLLPIIWSNIILEKPMRVVRENAYEDFAEDLIEIDEDEDQINEAFLNLKDFKN